MAAMSLRPRARQRCATDSGGCQSRRKWIPSRVKSVVTRQSFPAGNRSTAQSSPIPVRRAQFLPEGSEKSAIRRICAMSAFSASGTRFNIPLLGQLSGSKRQALGLLPPGAGRLAPEIIGNLGTMTSSYRSSVTGEWTCASLTRGTQFVTVNQSFTKPLAGL